MNTEKTAEPKAHVKAMAQALFVTFLWSISWVLIKMGLRESLPPLTFAGLRYSLAFLCLLPFVLANPNHRAGLRNISYQKYVQLFILGVVFYAVTQGAQFVGLAYLPAATLTLLLSLSPIFVALLGISFGQESSSMYQWGGIFLSTAGVFIYFLPLSIPVSQIFGLSVAVVGVIANAVSSLLGRRINHQSGLSPILVTTVSMGTGGLLLLVIGALTQGFGQISPFEWLIIGWLAVVNTAFAFTLWNHSLRALTAIESSIINNTMLPQIAILAWLLLDEPLTLKQVTGMVLVGVGTLIVQVSRYFPISRKSLQKQV
jgi:drug/metabolite transporter (DMT)-like permease